MGSSQHSGSEQVPAFVPSPNFYYLAHHDVALVQAATLAERVLGLDPVGALVHLRRFSELMLKRVAAQWGVYEPTSTAAQLTRALSRKGLPSNVEQLFRAFREVGNDAAHAGAGDQHLALQHLKLAFQLAVWFQRTFGNNRKFDPGSYAPQPTEGDTSALRSQLDELQREASEHRASSERARAELEAALAAEAARVLGAEEAARNARQEAEVWEAYAAEAEAKAADDQNALQRLQAELDAIRRQRELGLLDLQKTSAEVSPEEEQTRLAEASATAAKVELDEAATRVLIDQQLRDAGWEVDSETLRYSRGVRPQKNKCMAIAEWPTASGPADYVLFLGLEAVGIVEAKKKAKDVPAILQQAKRYAKDLTLPEGVSTCGGPWEHYKVPFLFATNGRPYLKQLETKSGIWHVDVRRPQNLAKALTGWHSPEGLQQLLKQDIDAANDKLKNDPIDRLDLRDYQQRAIVAVETAVTEGANTCLLAMATGTGKTRTAIGLIYRLLKSGRFRRILFLVDRSALGEQTLEALQSTKLENLQSFPEIYDVKGLRDITPDTDTKLHLATVQGMVRRLLDATDPSQAPTVDTYDCIIVDECHRGYGLDQELTEGEFKLAEYGIRTQADYISSYRRVLEHFDAVKIGLTATPAAHTTEIFGKPTFQYGYREAVIDGHLIDHEPPVNLVTKLAEEGIHFERGTQVRLFDPLLSVDSLAELEDEVNLEIDSFNRRVITENFNRVVCTELAKHLDPTSDEKTLIFAATDAHADTVVKLLKEAFQAQYGEVDDAAVEKITGTIDKPLERIRHFKNERYPNVAVTVDLLTTGIDVPKICNIVFLRRVRSRVLYEQMLGRATRLCPAINKAAFIIYDAVALYEALEPVTSMKPVVVKPNISFAELVRELQEVEDEEARQTALEQLIAKLQRKKQQMSAEALDRFEAAAQMGPGELAKLLKQSSPEQAAAWFHAHELVLGALERTMEPRALYVSDHHDELLRVDRGYGNGNKPEDYLDSFQRFVRDNLNQLPALIVVAQRPKELTRAQLKEVQLLLDAKGFTERSLHTAWRQKSNGDIAATILGFIRQAALGDPLVPYEERVKKAVHKLLASQPWTKPQRDWLERIGKQLKKEKVVDRPALDEGQFGAKGGFDRLNKVFDGKLEQILQQLSEDVWSRVS